METKDPLNCSTVMSHHTHTDTQPAQEYQAGCCLPDLLYIYPPPALPLFALRTEAAADGASQVATGAIFTGGASP